MAITVTTILEVESLGSDSNGGGFDPAATFATDLSAASGTTASPVVSSASYTFVAGDVGAWLFIKGGTNWTPGWYKIASVSAGAATLDAAVGHVTLYPSAASRSGYVLSTTAGCATAASPTSGTWGIDYSQQAASQVSYTDLVIGTTTTQLTSAAHPFGQNHVGNVLNITGGTGFTVQRLVINSVSGTTATCNASAGTASSTGGTATLGGAMATPAVALALFQTGTTSGANVCYIQKATFTTGVSIAVGASASASFMPLVEGYGTYRGDGNANTGNAPTIQATASLSTGIVNQSSGTVIYLRHLILDGNLQTTTTCFFAANNIGSLVLEDVVSKGFTSIGIRYGTSATKIIRCQVLGGRNGDTAGISSNSGNDCILETLVDNCSGIGMNLSGLPAQITDCIVRRCAGIGIANANGVLRGNIIYGNGSHGITVTNNSTVAFSVFQDNIIALNGGYGCQQPGGVPVGVFYSDFNAFYSNTSGNYNPNLSNFGGVNDINLTGDPFVDGTNGNFELNTTAGAGAACRASGSLGTFPGLSATVGFRDRGAVQSAAGGGGAKPGFIIGG